MEKDARKFYGEEMAKVGSVLSSPVRIAILKELMAGEVDFGKLKEKLCCGKSNLSIQLRILKDAGFVITEREGKNCRVKLAGAHVKRIFSELEKFVKVRVEFQKEMLGVL